MATAIFHLNHVPAEAGDLVVLQRRIGSRSTRVARWRTIAHPVTLNEGWAQLDAVREHPSEHRLLQGVPEAWSIDSVTEG